MWVENNSCVLTGNAILIWDGLTKPDIKDDGSKTWNVSVAVPANAPELVELEALRQKALREKAKPTVNVNTPGNNPVHDIDASKFPELPGYKVFKGTTTLGAPEVFDINGATLSPMVYGPQIYNGVIVRLILDAYTYDNKQKGVNFGLQSIQIVDATAPRLAIGAAGISTDAARAAFTGSAAVVPAPPAAGAVTSDFPPEGWLAHPSAPGHFYKGQEVLTEAALRAKYPPAAPVAVQAPPPPVQQAAAHQPPPPPHTGYMGTDQTPPPPPPAAIFPPQGWYAHPEAPGSFYNAAKEILTEAALRARVGA